MNDYINILSILVLAVLLVAAIFLAVLLYRANRILYKIDHISTTLKEFASGVVPAIVNMGTIAAAIQAILRNLTENHIEFKHPKKKD